MEQNETEKNFRKLANAEDLATVEAYETFLGHLMLDGVIDAFEVMQELEAGVLPSLPIKAA